ncbi:MAG: DUF445 family protein [Planctomycetes bacterium]|nr:DUF445 family protein [Planctomycetota bacterium]
MHELSDFLAANWKYLTAPVVCAFIGWLTNYVAVKMLFRPRNPVNLGVCTVHGVFPKRRGALAENLGNAIEKNLINHGDIQKVIEDPSFQQAFAGVAAAKIDDFLANRLTTINPMLAMFVTGELRQKIRDLLLAEIHGMLPEFLQTASTELQKRLVFHEIVRDKINGFDSEKIEELLFAVMKREFRFIEIVGGVLGFFIGVAQSLMFYL